MKKLPSILVAIAFSVVAAVYWASWRFPFHAGLFDNYWFVFGGGQFGIGRGVERIMWRWETMVIDDATHRAAIHWWFDGQSYPITVWVYQVPLWVLPAGAIALWTGYRGIVRVSRQRRGLCPACGYDVRNLSMCPECGRWASST